MAKLITIDPTALSPAQRASVLKAYGLHLQLTDANGAPRDATKAEVEEELKKHLQITVLNNLEDDRRRNQAPLTLDLSAV